MNDNNKILNVILGFLTVILSFLILDKLFKEIRSDSDIVSDEGKKILNNPEDRKKLRSAVDQYHEKGNWDGLDALNS